jgi:hypothetical protein
VTARNSVTIEVRKGALGFGTNLAAQFLDISEGGVRVVVKAALDEKNEVEVILTGHGVRKPIKRLAIVRWAVKLESGQFALGLRFDKRLSYQEVSSFGKP